MDNEGEAPIGALRPSNTLQRDSRPKPQRGKHKVNWLAALANKEWERRQGSGDRRMILRSPAEMGRASE